MTRSQEHRPAAAPDGAHPIRTAAIVIYATFVLLMLTIPQSLPNWLRDMNENPVQQALLPAASAVQAVSHAARLDVPYTRARAAFYAITGKEDE